MMAPDDFVLSVAHLHPSPSAVLEAVDRHKAAWGDFDTAPLVDGERPAYVTERIIAADGALKDYAEPFSTQPGYPDAWR